MPTSTTNFSLNKPLVNNATDQDLWGDYTNTNWDTVDSTLKTARDFLTRAITGADTATVADRNYFILANATSGALAPVLPSAVTVGAGFEMAYKKTDSTANAVTITRPLAQTIDGASTYVLSGQYDSVCLVSDGTNWHVKAYKTTPSSVASASTSAAGIIEIATSAEVIAGASSTLAVTPSTMATALGFKTYYESAEQSITLGSIATLSHSLGSIPKLFQCELVCKTIDAGWAVGDRLFVNIDQNSSRGVMPFFNTTQVGFIASNLVTILNKSTFTIDNITAASWRVVLRAWA